MSEQEPFMVLAPGFSNYYRKYPAYVERYGEENFAHTTNYKRYSIEDHLEEIESVIPENRSFMMIGYSMGGCNLIELLSRKALPNCKGVILVGAARILTPHKFLDFLFRLPVPLIYFLAGLIALLFPFNLIITGFNLKKAIPASFEGLVRLVENGAGKMKKEYNQCVRLVGKEVDDILEENKNIPLLIIRLHKDMMVDEEDLATLKTFFNKWDEEILPKHIIHLTHKFDSLYIEIIDGRKDFFGI
jgi:pimeloyl-ACP methyl ester carboxylesterase